MNLIDSSAERAAGQRLILRRSPEPGDGPETARNGLGEGG